MAVDAPTPVAPSVVLIAAVTLLARLKWPTAVHERLLQATALSMAMGLAALPWGFVPKTTLVTDAPAKYATTLRVRLDWSTADPTLTHAVVEEQARPRSVVRGLVDEPDGAGTVAVVDGTAAVADATMALVRPTPSV